MWSPAGSQAVDQLIWCFGPGSHTTGWSAAPGLSCKALGSTTLGLWVGKLASAPSVHPVTQGFRCGRPAGVSGVGGQLGFQLLAPSLLIWVRASRASGESWGCLSRIPSPGAEGGGGPETAAAVESSLTSH